VTPKEAVSGNVTDQPKASVTPNPAEAPRLTEAPYAVAVAVARLAGASVATAPVITSEDDVRPVVAAPLWVPVMTVFAGNAASSTTTSDSTRVPEPEVVSTRSAPMSSVQVRPVESLHRNAHESMSVPAVTGLLVRVAIDVPDTAEFWPEMFATPGALPESRYATTTAIHMDEPPRVAVVVVVAEL
jgi:hypothetical protein